MPLILVLDDDPVFREVISLRLRIMGYTTAGAGFAHAGLELARRLRPALILLDADMPGAEGTSLLQSIREDQTLRDTPIVLLESMPGTGGGYAGPQPLVHGRLLKGSFGFTDLADTALLFAGPAITETDPSVGRTGAA